MDFEKLSSQVESQVKSSIAELYKKAEFERPRLCIVASGGATRVATWFLGTPGASSTVLDISFPYHRRALLDYLEADEGELESFKFCSPDMARRMARKAMEKGFNILCQEEGGVDEAVKRKVLGVGYTGALATSRERRGEDQCFVALCCSDGFEALHSVQFHKGKSSRDEQDFLASEVVVSAITETFLDSISLKEKDESLVQQRTSEVFSTGIHDHAIAIDNVMNQSLMQQVWFWPQQENSAVRKFRQAYVHGISTSKLASENKFIVLSGSFNPLHEGHEKLASAARAKIASTTSRNVVVLFEIAINNVDKGAIDIPEVRRRVEQFAHPEAAKLGPWPVAVTTASRFIEKAHLFPHATFVIGYDTAIRLVDPKYYNDSEAEMYKALTQLMVLGCDFMVAGRKDASSGEFYGLERMRHAVPNGLAHMFQSLSEDEFRVDLSSTELRQQQQQQQKL